MKVCIIDDENKAEKHRVLLLRKEGAKDISALYEEVWHKAYVYPKEWREKRAMSEEELKKEMDSGHFFFGVRINGKLVGVYKASVTERGCFGEQQAVLANGCKVNYVNILAGNEPCERAMEKFNFYKTGEPWEQSKGMLVQTYERKVDS